MRNNTNVKFTFAGGKSIFKKVPSLDKLLWPTDKNLNLCRNSG